MNIKRICAVCMALLPLAVAPLVAEEPPMAGSGWYYHSGKSVYNPVLGWIDEVRYADSYNEQDGYALVQGRKLHYWLYDSLTNHGGNTEIIYNKIIPHWVEKMGYVIDYDNIYVYNPNPNLATSVQALMKQRNSDVSVALITDGNPHYAVINEYLNSKGVYKTTVYYLYR